VSHRDLSDERLASRELLALREGRPVSDARFDALFPIWARGASDRHFTPVSVARRAAALLVSRPGARILDVGAGVGKLCVVGALTTAGEFIGAEMRAHLVEAGRAVIRRHKIPRCRLVAADAAALDWGGYDGFYLFNPFAEHLPKHAGLDRTVPRDPERYLRDVRAVEERLAAAASGARAVLYYGFGGAMPGSWRRLLSEQRGLLELWQKQ
jgi:hypothetical protein